jgi:uncharacterized protein YigA (DUF484 family)
MAGAKIGDLFFDATVQDANLVASAKRAGDKAGAAAQTTFQRRLGAFKQGIAQGLGIGAFNTLGAAIQQVTSYLGDSVRAYREDEASQAKLRTSLQANVPAWNGNADAIERVLADRIKLGFSDDEQRDSLARLVAITHDVTKALDIQRTAMDLARLKNVSLADATELLGKVAGGNVGILKRYGISIGKNVSATEALAAVQKLTAGQAEAFAQTSEGKVVVAQTRAAEASEKFGKVLDKLATIAQEASVGPLEALATVLDGVDVAANQSTTSIDDQATALEGLLRLLPFVGDGLANEVEQGRLAAQQEDRHGDALIGVRSAAQGTATAVGDLADAEADGTDKGADFKDGLYDITDAAKDAESALSDLKDTIEYELFGKAINEGNLAQLRKTHDELINQRDAAKKGSREYKILTGQIAENEQAQFDLQLQMKDKEGAQAVIDWLKTQKRKFGDATGAIQALIDKYAELAWWQNHDFGTQEHFGGGPQGGGGGSSTTPATPAAAPTGAHKHKAAGGPVSAGVAYRVGERGPETFVAPRDGVIIPADRSLRIGPTSGTSAASSINVTIEHLDASGHANPEATAAAVQRAVEDGMASALRNQGLRYAGSTRR